MYMFTILLLPFVVLFSLSFFLSLSFSSRLINMSIICCGVLAGP